MTDRQLSQNAVIAAIEGEVSYSPAHGDTNRALERIIAAIRALPDPWRPIEEARRFDGAKILAYCPTLSPPEQVCVWSEAWQYWQSHPTKFSRHPTKFMPLPSPPEANDGQPLIV